MASLRLALKASLEASESQPAPKKKSTTTAPGSRNRDNVEYSQTSRKRSHSEASTGSVGDEQKAFKKKTSSSKEDVKEKESKSAVKERKATPSSASMSTTNSRRDKPPSSAASSSESSRPSIVETRERNTPTRKAAATANKQFSSPSTSAAPEAPSTTSSTAPTPPPSNKKGVPDKKTDDNGSGSVIREKKEQSVSAAVALEEDVKNGSKAGPDSNSMASKRDSNASSSKPTKSVTAAIDDKKSASSSRSVARERTDSMRSDDSKRNTSTPDNVMPTDDAGPKEKKDSEKKRIASSPVKDPSPPDGSVSNLSSKDVIAAVEDLADKHASVTEKVDTNSAKNDVSPDNGVEDAMSSGPPAPVTGLSIAMTEELRGMGGAEDSAQTAAVKSADARSKDKDKPTDDTPKSKTKKKGKDVEKLAGDKEPLISGSVSPSGEPRSSKKRSVSALTEEEAETTSEDKKQPRVKQDERSDDKVVKDGHQSPRAAAQVAKSRLSLSGTNKVTKTAAKNEADENGGDPSTKSAPSASKKSGTPREQKSARKKDKGALAPAHWVACDVCGKWRSLPGDLDISALPEQWFCSMNKWDSAHDDCSKEEEEYVDPTAAPAASMSTSRSTGSLSALDGEGSKKNRSSRGEGKSSSRKRTSRADGDGSDDEEGRKDGANRSRMSNSRRRSKGSARGGSGEGDMASSMSDMVSWVQCNKCSKWRKVPSSIGSELPDVWYCSMNTWAPEYSKCSTKEEEDEKVVVDDKVKDRKSSAAAGRGKYARGSSRKGEPEPSAAVALAPGKTVVKKIQWVQCERKNCKKWRKIPIEVDLSKLPDQWFCEMNQWDPERAACDLAEDSDDEGDQPANHAARTQLILGNSKGPGTLSYRRLIFGADGRIRPFYSEKNKNGYGLFSFTEVFRPSESDEYIMPTRRIGYWSSSSFDGSAKPRVQVPVKKKKIEEEEEVEPREVEYQTACSSLRPDHATYLMDTIQRLTPSSSTTKSLPPPPSTFLKAHPKKQKCTLFRRLQIACSVVQNYLLLFAGNPQPQTLEEVFYGLSTILFFHDPELELCRASMGKGELLDTLHRLDQAGTVEATYDNDGDLSFRLLLQRSVEHNMPLGANPFPALLASHEPTPLGGKAVPLKMRKRKIGLQSFPNLNTAPPPASTVVSARTTAAPTPAPSLPSSSSCTKLSDTISTVPPSEVKTEVTTEEKVVDDGSGDQTVKMEVDEDAVEVK
mmetsp:Transcript_30164/g.56068  ORF Transcript_30164/g.56068 Transcript_30164/m.56068 type:complete len:1220 (-) Transcript_30164:228-3887(-)